MPYTVAVALIYGTVHERHFDDRYRNDPALRALTRRVKVEVWEEANRRMPEAMLCRVTVITHSGDSYNATVDYHKGHWRNPMSETEVEEKFRKLAQDTLEPARIDRLLDRLWNLESLIDAGDVVRLTVAG